MRVPHPIHVGKPELVRLPNVLLVGVRLRVRSLEETLNLDLALAYLHRQLLKSLVNEIEMRPEVLFSPRGGQRPHIEILIRVLQRRLALLLLGRAAETLRDAVVAAAALVTDAWIAHQERLLLCGVFGALDEAVMEFSGPRHF